MFQKENYNPNDTINNKKIIKSDYKINNIRNNKINNNKSKKISNTNKNDDDKNNIKSRIIYCSSILKIATNKFIDKSLSNKPTKHKFFNCQKGNYKQKSDKKNFFKSIKKEMSINNHKNNKRLLFKNYDLLLNKEREKSKDLIPVKKLFRVKNEDLLYEVRFLMNNPKFIYDLEHQKDNNSNFQYINENFIDIIMLSFNDRLILNSTIKPMNSVQKEISFEKRNILISWLTEINLKYIRDQNILFLAIKYIDCILYKENININDFQLIGILCFNLALKLENSHKIFTIDEIIALIGNGDILKKKEKYDLVIKIKKTEMKICDILDFNLLKSTCVLILHRFIQIMNISNKNIESIFKSISYFFLEISIYEEQFYLFDDFIKALSSLIITKLILQQHNIKLGFHNYLRQCTKIKNEQIKQYFNLCQKIIKDLKHLKYGTIIFSKYQMKSFNSVVNTYLNEFINKCFKNKGIISLNNV